MLYPAYFGLCPLLLICATTALTRLGNSVRKLQAGIMWLNFAIICGIVAPVYRASESSLNFSVDFGLDRISATFVLLTNFVVAASLTQASIFFNNQDKTGHIFDPAHERWFYLHSTFFLVATDFVFLSQNLGFMWISLEATTLFSAALVYYNRDKHALEATWKYLIVCSVGIAFALFGTILLFASSQYVINEGTLDLRILKNFAPSLQPKLVQLGYVFCLLGYGTKAGLFPLHTWLPDAHSEAPAPASAMLSGTLLNCSLFAIYKLTELVRFANQGFLAVSVTTTWGAITMLTASLFLVNQGSLKRLWAYSSIENVGIMVSAIGLGSPSIFLLQAINHSLAKAALFLISGNIIQAQGTKEISQIRGILAMSPVWGTTLIMAAAAIVGMPPFGTFIAEWLILIESVDRGQYFCAISLTLSLTLAFIAISAQISKMVLGAPRPEKLLFSPSRFDSGIPLLLCILLLLLGVTGMTKFLLDVL